MDEIKVIETLGSYGLLAGALVALTMGWVVPRWVHNDVRSERDFWRQAYVDASTLARRVTTVADQIVSKQ